MMRDGVYYLKNSDQIVLLTNVQNYEDLTSEFSIVTWEYSKGIFKKVLLTSDQYKRFRRIGSL